MIQLDISSYKTSANKISISFCGTEENNYFQVYGSNTSGNQGTMTLLQGAVSDQYFEIKNFESYDFLSITSKNANVLVKTVKMCLT